MLQVELPGTRGATVAAAPVGQDLQGFGLGIVLVPFGAPPLLDAVDGERRGVGGLADEDGAGIGARVVDAVGDGAALGRGWKVVVVVEMATRKGTPISPWNKVVDGLTPVEGVRI